MTRPRTRLAFAGAAVLAVALVVWAVVALNSDDDASGPSGSGTLLRSKLPPGTTVAFLGDSYTYGSGATSPADRWSTLVSKHFGWTELNFGLGGSGYQAGQANGGSYSQRIASVADARPDVVVVSGGLNDYVATLTGPAAQEKAIGATFAALRRALPKALLIAIRPFWVASPTPPQMTTMGQEVRRAVESVGGVYADIGQPLSGREQDIAIDTVHPNDAGHAELAEAIELIVSTTTVPKP